MKDIRGDIQKYRKIDIAMEHLNLALKEYVEEKNMFSVIHLAGAAEEMLGEIVRINKGENALDKIYGWFRSWYRIAGKDSPSNSQINNYILKTKNSVKHINDQDDLFLEIDLNREAQEIIRRAIENFNQLPELSTTPEMLAYYRHEKT